MTSDMLTKGKKKAFKLNSIGYSVYRKKIIITSWIHIVGEIKNVQEMWNSIERVWED